MRLSTRALLLSLVLMTGLSSARSQDASPETSASQAQTQAQSETQTDVPPEAQADASTDPSAAVKPDVEAGSVAEEAADASTDSTEVLREPAQANPRSGSANRNSRRGNRAARPAAPGAASPTGTALGASDAASDTAADSEGLRVSKIDIRGNKKIEVDAVSARLVSKVGEPYSAEKIRADIKALFKTGYFYDVRVDRTVRGQDADLVYTLVEKPSMTEIVYRGNSEVETNDIQEATGLKSFEILNMGKIREATEKIQKLYEDKGYFLARITPKVEPIVQGESVRVTFDIKENDKVKVKRITFLGNRNLPDGRLKGVMQTQEGGFFSFISGSGAYKQDAFDRDIQLLNYVYFNEGYVQVRVDRPQVYVTPDKKGIYITIRVEEGDRFKVGTVDFAGDLLFERSDLENSVEIDGSGWYAHETLLKDLRTLQAKYGDLGYAYANIIPRTRIREKEKEVDITFEIDKGNKVYFGRINVVGNTKTRDKVVRRELMIREGELYNETRRRESLDNVKRLGFFEDVQFNGSTPTENPDLMNIDIVVKERNTGSIQVGAGYSTHSSFIFNGQVNQINLFGRGQKLGVSVDISSKNALYNLNFTEPYFFDTEWSVGADAYQSKREVEEYDETKKGGALRVGHPLAPYLRGYLRYKLDETEIELDSLLGDPDLFPVQTANGLTSSMTLTLEYDKRNDRFAPTKGVYSSASIEYAGLGGDKRYTKGLFTGRFYEKVFWEFVLRNNLTYGFIRPNVPGEEPPYNELFLLGGANSLRGYEWYSIGRRRLSNKRLGCLTGVLTGDQCPRGLPNNLGGEEARERAQVPFGGTQQFYYQAELEFPLITEAGIKGVVFYDIGNADDILTLDGLRQDVGFGFRWFSPIGPLRFEWGFPIDRLPDERPSAFQFAIGSPF